MNTFVFVFVILIACVLHKVVGCFCSNHSNTKWSIPFYLVWVVVVGTMLALFLKEGWLAKIGLETNAVIVITLGLSICYFIFEMSQSLKKIRNG